MPQKTTKKRIELLCPAGDIERLKTAVIFGADAVYCGLPSWSMRNMREITFTITTLKEGIEFAHEKGVKVYLTFNIYPHESQIRQAEADLKKIKKLGLKMDGIIVSDLGMFSLVKKYFPDIPIHISTQANTINSKAIEMWAKLGADRIVLARELTLKEVKDIKQKLKIENCKLKIECFGHGAMCMAYSGRCLLSKYFTGREANLGECAQSCRWKYKVKIEEETRPGDLIDVQEDSNGTYFMNSKEICSLDILDKFIEAGIDSLKIEGRAKTVYYLATVTRAYRKAIDAYYEKEKKLRNLEIKKLDKEKIEKKYKKLINDLRKEFDLIQNRGYSHGFLLGRHDYEQEYNIAAFKPNVLFLGIVLESKNHQLNTAAQFDGVKVEVKNKFKVGEKIEIVTPDEIIKTKIKEIKDQKGIILQEILKPQEKVWIKFDTKKDISERSILRKIIKKE
ncbi:MAG TPA: U32 family peptidase [Patescibacteria group bacterium]|nr:U32 family peptidase [Patescibacteria group bacterium]